MALKAIKIGIISVKLFDFIYNFPDLVYNSVKSFTIDRYNNRGSGFCFMG